MRVHKDKIEKDYYYMTGIRITEPKKRLDIDQIVKVVSKVTGISVNEMRLKRNGRGNARRTDAIMAKQLCYTFIRRFTNLSLCDIGKHFGHTQKSAHSNVIHGCYHVNDLIQVDVSLRDQYDKIKETLEKMIV